MNHPTADTLLLLAYNEQPPAQTAEIEQHLAACDQCRAQLADLERGRVALDFAMPSARPRLVRWIGVVLAAAAVLVALVLVRPGSPPFPPRPGWQPVSTWSATAGYIAGGKTTMEIDAQLTRLEQERYHGSPD